jgi:protein ImuB
VHKVLDVPALHHALDLLPLAAVPGFEALLERAMAMGLHTLADLRALPRDGVTRRFGGACLQQIDRARGDVPDPQLPIRPPETFASRLELFARADTGEQVWAGAQMLLQRLLAWARARQGRVERLTLMLHHEPWRRADDATPAATPLVLTLAEPSNDPSHLHSLLREHLARLRLPAPTLELSLHCAHLAAGPAPHGELFPTHASEQADLRRLLERLQARLGSGQIQRLHPTDDHRPERATAWHRLDEPSEAAPTKEFFPKKTPGRAAFSCATWGGRAGQMDDSRPLTRPVWLMDPPQPLPTPRPSSSDETAWLDGQPLQLLAGPERIESGWWDGRPAVRDYFIAQSVDGALVWIYRSRLPEPEVMAPGWFLQGRFA